MKLGLGLKLDLRGYSEYFLSSSHFRKKLDVGDGEVVLWPGGKKILDRIHWVERKGDLR